MTTLAERFEVRRRFHRSVHLSTDANRADACDGYALTGVGRATLTRMLGGLAPGGIARAWSLTGPYGAGKSAFVVLLTQLLRRPLVEARALLRSVDGGRELGALLDRVRGGDRGFTPVLITATFGSLVHSILDAIEAALHGRRGARVERALNEAHAIRVARGRATEAHRRVVALMADLAALSCDAHGGGVVLVIDELGKTLEHAARGDARADEVFLLQELAELAARSGDTPLLLVTLLHQSFDRYAKGLNAHTRAEWAKVQGRFDDVAFLDAPAELLRLAARSIHRRGGASRELFSRYDALAHEAVTLGLIDAASEPLLRDLAPIHPTVALLLPTLFRGPLAQNERSLFDFLSSRAPGSFGDFVATCDEQGASYSVDRLYDFLTSTLGPAQFSGPEGRQWAAVDEALARLGDRASPRSTSIVKAIGVLSILGSRAVRASRETLRFALSRGGDDADIARGIDDLREASHIVYRRHSDAFALWGGSDVDLDARFDEARRVTPAIESLSDLLRERAVLRPKVARRHFIETGTLRYFDVSLATPEGARLDVDEAREGADGRIVYLLPAGDESPRDLVEIAARTSHAPDVVVGVPEASNALLSVVRDWCAWETVRTRGGDLDGDAVARKELASRIRATSVELDAAVAACFGVGDDVSVSWVRGGAVQSWSGPRGVTWGLSAVCDEAYAEGPRLRNELLNRQSLSSAAAAARRALLDAMIASGDRARLGIEGAPPEWSMYACLLAEGGIHRERGGVWGFGPPPPEDPLRLAPTWRAIEAFLDTTGQGARPLRELFAALARRPIGLREGPAPVLFFSVALASPGEVALFEDGTFVAELSGAVVERLLRRIDHFSVARYRVTGDRAAAVEALRAVVGADAARPIDLVRAIVRRVSGLPRYTRSTRRVGPLGLAAREAILAARDPLKLLFQDLPTALGVDPIEAVEGREEAVENYARSLKSALSELGDAYPALLSSVEAALARGFDIDATGDGFREALTTLARRLTTVAVDLRLRAFLGRAMVTGGGLQEWIEGVAMVVGNRPPSEWSDAELARFELGVEELCALVRRAESLSLPVTPPRPEVRPEDAPLVADAEREILRVLEASLGGRREVWLAALGRTLHRVMESAPRVDAERDEGRHE